ncbi:MAG TPA: hypothetical protein VJ260_08790 [Vicinamibacterales bacterium]|jgi:hypothetical protein|nr:hypothetical protein [Vicinamibacterales bacterium]
MEHSDFHIGEAFWTATGEWRCTDVGTRTIVAVKIDATGNALVFDEDDFEGCFPTAADRDADRRD